MVSSVDKKRCLIKFYHCSPGVYAHLIWTVPTLMLKLMAKAKSVGIAIAAADGYIASYAAANART